MTAVHSAHSCSSRPPRLSVSATVQGSLLAGGGPLFGRLTAFLGSELLVQLLADVLLECGAHHEHAAGLRETRVQAHVLERVLSVLCTRDDLLLVPELDHLGPAEQELHARQLWHVQLVVGHGEAHEAHDRLVLGRAHVVVGQLAVANPARMALVRVREVLHDELQAPEHREWADHRPVGPVALGKGPDALPEATVPAPAGVPQDRQHPSVSARVCAGRRTCGRAPLVPEEVNLQQVEAVHPLRSSGLRSIVVALVLDRVRAGRSAGVAEARALEPLLRVAADHTHVDLLDEEAAGGVNGTTSDRRERDARADECPERRHAAVLSNHPDHAVGAGRVGDGGDDCSWRLRTRIGHCLPGDTPDGRGASGRRSWVVIQPLLGQGCCLAGVLFRRFRLGSPRASSKR